MEKYDAGLQFIPYGFTTKFRKVLITGLGRSGTSAVASVFNHIGFYLGDDSEAPIYEDVVLRTAFKEERLSDVRSTLERSGLEHRLVAWKDPKLFSAIGSQLVGELTEDWLMVLVFRDPVATTLRRVFSDKVSFMDTLLSTVRLQEKLVQFGMTVKKPILFVSYEKLLLYPEQVIGEILGFVDLDPGLSINADDILAKISSDKEAYRSHAALKVS